jgi:sterol 3beta-glucosyltransferase
MATLKDDGTVVVDIPTTIEAASLDLHSEDHQNVAFGGEPLDSSDLQDRPCWGLVLKCYELRTRQHRKC